MRMLFCFLCAVALVVAPASARVVNISNTALRVDNESHHPLDVHDGNILLYMDREAGHLLYFYYGLGYQDCATEHSDFPPQWCPGIYYPYGRCGFRTDHAVRVYSSPDLVNWTLRSENILPVRPFGIYFRPKVVFNMNTRQFVMWIHRLPNATSPLAGYALAALVVAVADKPNGPFTVVNEAASTAYAAPGDFTIMALKAENGFEAYIAYTAWSNSHSVVVEKLNREFTDTMPNSTKPTFITPANNEAPVLFRRGDWFYLLFGELCCFCREGAASNVYVAADPLGPWQPMHTDINPFNNSAQRRVVAAQGNYVFAAVLANSTLGLVWTGDRWASAPDGLKSHDLQYWQPLRFDDSRTPPTIMPLTWADWFTMDIKEMK